MKCPVCHEDAIETSRFELGTSKVISLKCGHILNEEPLKEADYSSIKSTDGRFLMPFQVNGVKFLENANGRALIADEQGLGKTVQVAAFCSLHGKTIYPAVVVTKTKLKVQWMFEFFKWTDTKRVQVISTSKEIAVPGMDVYIVTYDILKDDKVFAFIKPKTLILDECQAVKNHISGRALAVQTVGRECEYILATSGTPIKNHSGEYFTILNLIRPNKFPSMSEYISQYCEHEKTAWGYKVGGLSNIDKFKGDTEDFIIRRTQADVLPDLFALRQPRKFHHVELDRRYNKAYAAALDELDTLLYKEEDENTTTAIIAIMTKLRQITGLSKVPDCIEFITDYLLSTDRKILIFVHHHNVFDLLEKGLNDWMSSGALPKVASYRAGSNREDFLEKMKSSRVGILSSLAAGEGLDGLQHLCSDMILLERQWNPANEEQVEGRLGRIGQTKPVNFTYFIATETIDEYFTELVEAKRAIIAQTLDGKEMIWDQNSLMKDLAHTLTSKGKKKWKL